MSGFDWPFRILMLVWVTRSGSRLSGCPRPRRRTAPYVIGLRFSGRRAFSFCHHGGEFRAEALDVMRGSPGWVCPALLIVFQALRLESRTAFHNGCVSWDKKSDIQRLRPPRL